MSSSSDSLISSSSEDVLKDCPENDPDTHCEKIEIGGGVIQSLDGNLSLDIPSGALKEGVVIGIQKLQTMPDVLPDSVGEVEGYEFFPDGLVFEKPIQFTLKKPILKKDSLGQPVINIYSLITFGGGVFEALDSVQVWVESDSIVINTQMKHFSFVFLKQFDGVAISALPPIPGVVDQTTFGTGFRVEAEATTEFRGNLQTDDTTYPRVSEGDRLTILFETEANGDVIEPEYDLMLDFVHVDGAKTRFAQTSISGTCLFEGKASVQAKVSMTDEGAFALALNKGEPLKASFILNLPVECQKKPLGLAHLLLEGVYQLPIIARLFSEGSFFFGAQFGSFTNGIGISGDEGASLIEPKKQQPVPLKPGGKAGADVKSYTEAFTMGTEFSGFGIWGITGISHANPGPESPALVLTFGPNGGGFTEYYPDYQDFGITTLLSGTIMDAVPFNNRVVSPGLAFVKTSGNNPGINFIVEGENQFDPEANYRIDYDNLIVATEFPDAGELRSVFPTGVNGPILVISESEDMVAEGHLFYKKDSVITKVGDVGKGPRRIRCLSGVCAVSNYVSKTLTVLSWPAINTAPTIVNNVSVGDGPVGIDMFLSEDNHIYVVSTGFNDRSFSLTKLDQSGNVVSNEKEDLPEECQNPGHAIFVPGEEPSLVITCNGSENFVVKNIDINQEN